MQQWDGGVRLLEGGKREMRANRELVFPRSSYLGFPNSIPLLAASFA